MKILSAAQMQDVDRLTIEAGIPGIILMENAAHRVVEYMAARFAPLSQQRIVVLCGKGNNGGDGLAIARQLHTRFAPRSLRVVLTVPGEQLTGDAAQNLLMLRAAGMEVSSEITPKMRHATLVVDAVLGTGIQGAATGRPLDFITEINSGFPYANVVAVDVPSGMVSDAADNPGPCARADATVTFTAPKLCHALAPNCDRTGDLVVAPIGSPATLYENDPVIYLALVEPKWFTGLFAPRARGAHKGDFGHVLTIAGSVGKAGAAAMTGLAALRSGAGRVTIASAGSAIDTIAAHAPELMTEPLLETKGGAVSVRSYPMIEALSEGMTTCAAGPGLSMDPDTVTFVRTLYEQMPLPVVLDADGVSAMSGPFVHPGGPRILTPHPGEMARFCGVTTEEIQSDRIGFARAIALDRGITIVLKGQRTVIAFPDGRVWINPTGTPALGTAGSGDILTGMIASLMGQHLAEADYAIAAAVWLHGRAGEIGAAALGEKPFIATDILKFLPEAMRELTQLSSEL